MANIAAYSGLRWGELAALTIRQVDTGTRVITVDRKVVEVAGHLYVEAPKCRKFRRTIYPRRTPGRLPAGRAARRPDRGGPRRAGSRHQPARADLPLARGASTGGRPTSTAASWPARLPGGRVARRATATAGGPGTACGTCSAPPPCSPGSSTPPTCPAWPATPTTASPSTCTSAPPPASSTAPARPPTRPCPSAMRDRAWLTQAVACPVPPRRHGGAACLTLISIGLTSPRCVLPPRPRNSRRQ